MPVCIPSIHVFLGRPLFLLSHGIQSIINFGMKIIMIIMIMNVKFTTSNRDQYGPHSTPDELISYKVNTSRPGQEIYYCIFKTVFRPACPLSFPTSVHLSPHVYILHLRDSFRCAPKSLRHNRALFY